MGHQRNSTPRATSVRGGLESGSADAVAAILQGLATPSRLHLLAALQSGPRSVGELVDIVGMEQSAVSHQLRHLRDLGFVVSERHGRSIVYELYDDHVLDIIEQALAHAEHLRLAEPDGGGPARGR